MDRLVTRPDGGDTPSRPGGIKNLLIVKLSAVGDVVMTLPALAALRRAYPGAAIDWLVEPAAAGILTGHPDLNRLLVAPRKELARLGRSGRLIGVGRLWSAFRRELRAVEYDVVLDLQGLAKSAALVWQARGRRKVGFARTREWTGWALNEKMPAYDPDRHAALRYLDAAVYLGAERPASLPERYYTPPPAAEAEADTLLTSRPRAGERFVVLNPGAKWATKRWPAEYWGLLAARLAGETGLGLIITGGPEDAPFGEAIRRAAPDAALDLCGRTSLSGLAAVLARAEAVVTCDTGPMHLAAAGGAGGLALFGPTRPWRTGPFGGRFQVLTGPLACQGCLRKRCDQPCLELVTPDEVWDHLQAWLKDGGASITPNVARLN